VIPLVQFESYLPVRLGTCETIIIIIVVRHVRALKVVPCFTQARVRERFW
jgi:hypothetical protein